jgi:uncharacterized membrane protein
MKPSWMAHPLKLTCLASLSGLLISQFSLFFRVQDSVGLGWAALLSLLLLLPLKGLLLDQIYTYKWVGFLALFYICIGFSELVSNPELRLYAYTTTLLGVSLFLGSIYYTRYLRHRA